VAPCVFDFRSSKLQELEYCSWRFGDLKELQIIATCCKNFQS
jgi:hypothetical protein